MTIKPGDKVRIVRSRFVKRIGYPLVFTDLRQEFDEHPKLEEALRLLGVMGENSHCAGWAKRDAVEGLAKAAVRFRGWGGRERRIHYRDDESDYTGQEAEVLSKRVRQTGDYSPPRSGQSYEGEWDYEPGFLANMKAHVILSTTLGDIEVCDVEVIP